jgi:hypothetical protein
MPENVLSAKDLIEGSLMNGLMGRPHLVILGAGASKAAFPDGDRNGLPLPVMNDLIPKLGLDEKLEEHGIDYKDANFEAIYSKLHERLSHSELVKTINERVRKYFASLQLPDEPTLYDHLVLSLRPKDVIATFNWDPFLFDACERNCNRTELPYTIYLHGNVRVGYCLDDMVRGRVGRTCGECGHELTPSNLLYPVSEKNYSEASGISHEWESLRNRLESAYIMTIFGYSAPESDVEAVELMSDAWGSPAEREFEEVEVIDLKSRDELRETWDDFIHTHHFRVYSSFYDSLAAIYPRRSCEALWSALMQVTPAEELNIPREVGFTELYSRINPLLEAERST